MCIEVWLGSPVTLSVFGVRSVLAAEPLAGGDPLEVVSQLHGHKDGHWDHEEGCEKDDTACPGVEILALHLPVVLTQQEGEEVVILMVILSPLNDRVDTAHCCKHEQSILEGDVGQEGVVVADTHTIVDPGAVMVESLYALMASCTVSAPDCPQDLAFGA